MGTVQAPPSKSMTIRMYAAGLLARGTTTVVNCSRCSDAYNALKIVEAFGADTIDEGDIVTVNSSGLLSPAEIDCGESALNARLFGIIGLLGRKRFVLNGSGTLLNRKLGDLQLLYLQIGAMCSSTAGRLPFTVEGTLEGGDYMFDGSSGSQALSGLLFTLPLAGSDSYIRLQNITSKPYIDMTLDVLKKFGIAIENNNYRYIYIKASQEYRNSTVVAEGDWSGAAAVLAAGAVGGRAELTGLNLNSLQGDKNVLDALAMAGARIATDNDRVISEKGSLTAFEFDFTDTPDLFPPLIVLACCCKGDSVFSGTDRLRFKESNRVAALVEELTKMGASFVKEPGRLIVRGGTALGAADVSSHNDHRLAMALMVAASMAKGTTVVRGVECLDKSWPGFIDDFGSLINYNYKIEL